MLPDRVLRRLLRSEPTFALFGDLVRALAGIAVVICFGAWIAYYMFIVPTMFNELHMNDFGKFYYSTQLYLDGQGMYGPSPATEMPVGRHETRQLWNLNPPHFHLLILPLAGLSPLPAYALWSAINIVALGLTLVLISRELRLRWTMLRIIWALVAVVIWSATYATVLTGQLTFLLTLGITVAWRAARQGRWTEAALWLGMLASVKPFLGVFWLYLIATRRFRPAMVMAGTASACFALGLVVFGWVPHADWLRAIGDVIWTWAPMNASVAGIVARTLDVSPFFKPTWHAPSLVPLLSWLGAGVIALITYREVVVTDDAGRIDRSFLLLLLMAQLVAPLGWVYYTWLVVGPLLAWWPTRARSASTSMLWCVAVLGFVCPVPFTIEWAESRWTAPTIGSAYFWMIISVWCAVMFSRRQPAAAP